MSRVKLPDRRHGETVSFETPSGRYSVTGSIDDTGTIREIFISGAKYGSEMHILLSDAAILISRLLQHGESLDDLALSLWRDGHDTGESAPSVLLHAMIALVQK